MFMPGRLGKIEEWTHLAQAADFHPGKMASLCLVSERQLQRYFQERFHTTPSQWLRQLQCRMAAELLSRGYSTNGAADTLKFANGSHFCREFKKHFGVPPQTFSPQWKASIKNVANRL